MRCTTHRQAISIGGVEMMLPLDEVRLVAPLPRPPSLRDFYAFEQHVATANRNRGRDVPPAWYELPVFYFGNHSAIYGPNAGVPIPRTEALDYELEIACVIGRAVAISLWKTPRSTSPATRS